MTTLDRLAEAITPGTEVNLEGSIPRFPMTGANPSLLVIIIAIEFNLVSQGPLGISLAGPFTGTKVRPSPEVYPYSREIGSSEGLNWFC